MVEQWESSEVKSASPVSRGTVVPDSIQSKALNSMEMERMWEGNKRVDLRMRDTASWMAEEAIGIIERDEELRCSAMDLSAKCEIREEMQVISTGRSVASSPINRGPQYRAKLAEVIEYGGNKERPKTKGTDATRIVNGSLSDLDFLNRKRVILREVEETVQLGKLIGVAPTGNETVVIQDIAHIIAAQELQQ
ncbi:hypothetical protein V6N13_018805 [Hibiscus sabdariffa]